LLGVNVVAVENQLVHFWRKFILKLAGHEKSSHTEQLQLWSENFLGLEESIHDIHCQEQGSV
jgi:hypothetical protein